jgi:hypothetical protein
MRLAAAPIVFALLVPGLSGATADRPKLTLTPNHRMVSSPAHVVVTASVTGGADYDQQLYCPDLEWEWGDGTKSEESSDCDPFQTGKTEIKRHFTAEHAYLVESSVDIGRPSTDHEVSIRLRLKKYGKTVLSGVTSVRIKPQM